MRHRALSSFRFEAHRPARAVRCRAPPAALHANGRRRTHAHTESCMPSRSVRPNGRHTQRAESLHQDLAFHQGFVAETEMVRSSKRDDRRSASEFDWPRREYSCRWCNRANSIHRHGRSTKTETVARGLLARHSHQGRMDLHPGPTARIVMTKLRSRRATEQITHDSNGPPENNSSLPVNLPDGSSALRRAS